MPTAASPFERLSYHADGTANTCGMCNYCAMMAAIRECIEHLHVPPADGQLAYQAFRQHLGESEKGKPNKVETRNRVALADAINYPRLCEDQ